LTIPIPAAGLRAHTGPIEEALSTVRELDCLLEAGLADGVESAGAVDTELVRALVRTAELQATELSEALGTLTARYSEGSQVEAARGYVGAAAAAYGGFLQRIGAAAPQWSERAQGTDTEVAEGVMRMLDEHPWRRR
jgi:colicin import membrane protein